MVHYPITIVWSTFLADGSKWLFGQLSNWTKHATPLHPSLLYFSIVGKEPCDWNFTKNPTKKGLVTVVL